MRALLVVLLPAQAPCLAATGLLCALSGSVDVDKVCLRVQSTNVGDLRCAYSGVIRLKVKGVVNDFARAFAHEPTLCATDARVDLGCDDCGVVRCVRHSLPPGLTGRGVLPRRPTQSLITRRLTQPFFYARSVLFVSI